MVTYCDHASIVTMGRTPKGQTRNKVYQYVRRRILAGMPPTVREVQQALGFQAVQTAKRHLENLVAEGKLVKEGGGKARGFRLPSPAGSKQMVGRTMPWTLVPLVGRVQAGALTEAVEDPQGHVPVVSRLPSKELFALRVRGESMTGAGILPDDLVIVRRQPFAESGEIVVALSGGEATVKRLRLRNGRVELHPENPDFEPILLDSETGDLRILGKVIEVRRYLDKDAMDSEAVKAAWQEER